ncbi:ABC transporter substrate-binding protein [Nocardia mangyaensis]|uniref:ABC transporter substrate-binding protein n=1 Tax=Nocardia mangyaensis TaxID=2213200 RepID=UPI002676DA16|nr:ABC transporter substrate-binding protein [Nocardia mangyaensis]MDO3646640.1 ABC transporter substrate-binding protein [Nocardia mangyaensis]
MKHSPRQLLSVIVAALLLVVGLTACISTPDGGGDTAAVKIGTLRGQPHLYAPYFMQQFAPTGTTYDIVLFENSPDIKNALASGAIDFGVLGAPSMLAGSAAGQNVRIIASAADGGSGFVGKADITTPNDLRGKKIGFPQGSSQEIALKLTLRAHGIDPATDVELVNLAYSDMANAYKSGRIDAFLSAETAPSIVMQDGAHQIVSPYDTAIGPVNIVFGTSSTVIDRDRELVEQTVRSFVQAIEYMLGDRTAWVDGLVSTFGLDRTITETAANNVWLRWELDDAYRQRLAALAEQMLAFDQLGEAPDLPTLIDPSFLSAAGAGQ